MGTFFGVISIVALCGTLLTIAMLVAVSLPQSPLRAALVQVLGWVFVAFCVLYFVSPVDILPEAFLGPFGMFDDIGAAIAAVVAARAAWRAGKDKAAMASANKPRLEHE